MPEKYVDLLTKKSIRVIQTDSLDEALPQTDVLYVTRVQKERFRDLDVYEKLKHRYIITKEIMDQCKKTSVLMHPFPRVGEISEEVDADPRSIYLTEQMRNGMYVRMALLSLVLRKGNNK
jgi:aspartate carbamoyltransferase catalytic subunit